MTYIVLYKSQRCLGLWKKIKKVKGDGILETGTHRFFILEDETRIEIPLSYHFRFSKERFFVIKQNTETKTGVDLKTNN